MRHNRIGVICLSVALVGCQSPQGTPQAVTQHVPWAVAAAQQVPDLVGRIQLAERSAQASMAEVMSGATVSMIDASTSVTVETALTDASGSFRFAFRAGFGPDPAAVYFLEAYKGLDSLSPGSSAVRVRTLVRYAPGQGWTSLTSATPGQTVVISPTTTAVAVAAVLRNQHSAPVNFAALIASVDAASASYTPPGGSPVSTDDISVLGPWVSAELTAGNDPVAAIGMDGLTQSWFLANRVRDHMAPDDHGDPKVHHDYVKTVGGVSSTFVWVPVFTAYQLINPANCGGPNVSKPVGYWVGTQPTGTENVDWAKETFGGFYAGKYEASHSDAVPDPVNGAGATAGSSSTLKVARYCVPWVSLDWDTAANTCLSYDSHCHLIRDDEWTALAVWSMIHGLTIYGNNAETIGMSYSIPSDIDDPGVTFLASGSVNGVDRALTGTGTKSAWIGAINLTTHTGTTAGVYDLNGNVWEWTETIGAAITSGNYMINDITVPVSVAGGYISSLSTDSRLRRYGVAGATSSVGTVFFGNDYLWKYTPINAKSLRGGDWGSGAGAGVWALYLGNARSNVSASVGFRPVLRF